MERVTYRITLDTQKTGIQRTLQGFETGDKLARRIAISLVAKGNTIELPPSNIVAMMYVTTPSAKEPSINACTIKDSTIIYDVIPITEEGITEMQLKLVCTCVDGAKSVLSTPRFAVEVAKSNTNDEGAEQNVSFTALEDAIAKSDAVYNSRLLRVEIGEDHIFRVHYADGNIYENDCFKSLLD